MERFPDLSDVEVLRSDPTGELYRAHYCGLDHPVAVQALATPVADDESVRRFEHACSGVHSLAGHPHIVPVHAWDLTGDGRPYVVTDLLDGGSLAGRVREAGPLPVVDVLHVGMVVADALASAHEQGAVHGDVRPDCILVAPSGEPALGGFGLSALAADPTSGAPLPAHAAPEVVDGGSGNAVSDLYSLGSTLLTLLTGCGPETALVDCLNRVSEPAGRDPSLLPPGADGERLPDCVVRMLARLTATDPEERPADARAAALVLRATAEEMGLPIPEQLGALLRAGEDDDDGYRSIEPQLTRRFDARAEPGATRPPAPRGALALASEAVPVVHFVPLVDDDAAPAVVQEAGQPRPAEGGRLHRRAVPLVAAALLAAAAVVGLLLAFVTTSNRRRQTRLPGGASPPPPRASRARFGAAARRRRPPGTRPRAPGQLHGDRRSGRASVTSPLPGPPVPGRARAGSTARFGSRGRQRAADGGRGRPCRTRYSDAVNRCPGPAICPWYRARTWRRTYGPGGADPSRPVDGAAPVIRGAPADH